MPPLSGGLGDRIEDYEVLNLLGKGGFASVYRARCLRTGMEVAIKMIDTKMMRAAGMAGRVAQEVSIHTRLKHPAILELYTFFEDTNYVYMVLELCHNGELQRFLKAEYPHGFPEDQAARIIKQVVQGLLYLHAHQILHRDMSLSNLLLTRDMQVKIADFGLATQLTRPDEKHMTMCGTPNYISPEVATRSSHGLEADVWGLGCLLYTLLVGRPPFDTDAVKSTLTRVVMADYKIPSYLSDVAQDLIERLLKKNPMERIKLKDIPKHPFIVYLDKERPYHDKVLPRAMSSDVMVDSGLGRTLSSCGRMPRLRSRSEERTSTVPALITPARPQFSTRSDPITDPNILNQNHRRKQTNSSTDNLVLSGIPRPGSRVFSQNMQMSHRRSNDVGREDTDRQNSERQKRRVNPAPTSCPTEPETHTKLQIPPLNTERLLPTRHRTKNFVLTILDSGEVCIEFIKKKNSSIDRINEVCRISNDGLRIVLYKPDIREIGDQPPPLPSRGADNIYSYESLPSRHHQKYLYAAKFVKMVKMKTPKLTLYTPKAKCLFMENGPHPDCELHFYDGIKVTKVDGIIKLFQKEGGGIFNEGDVPRELEEYLEIYQECYQRCLLLESSLASLGSATGHSYFPAIVGRRPVPMGDGRSQGKENVSRTTCSPLVMPSFDATCSVVSGVTTRSRKMNSMRFPSYNFNKVTVPGVGVAIQMPSGDIKVEYKDGSSLTISPQSVGGGIVYESITGAITRYSRNHQSNSEVPYTVREKLKDLPTIIKHLAQPKHRNLR
ncbi:serine/threonine-protein kinase PLK4 [Fopius arisanus]|uniref:Serine/threonine-protein kinase PLK4 n=1 Tax=Fopius arisanus TaxID=64838 RepID=A0A0C9QF99_9HYME|nr:PREDICTED: serine/threonine-protein kinase PLK4 [Fopius arisanus]XP_011308657.1 PREDICTED: serine/threonine-protein kinase PLK4 [Fopius arisanus]